jgi:hypothetical protein
MSDPTNTPNPDSHEPLLTVGAITAGVTAILALVVAFGFKLSATQAASILGVVAVVAPFVVGIIGRAKAYSPATVARLLAAARRGQG